MTWQFTPYVVPLYLGVLMLLAIALAAWQRRNTIMGGRAVALLSVLASIYILGYAFEVSSTRLADVKFWLRVEYIGSTLTPLVMFYMVANYTGFQRMTHPLLYLVLLPLPLTTLIFAWTNDYHGLIWQNMTLEQHGSTYFVDFTPGGWYWVNVVYIWTFVPAGLVMVLRAYPRMVGVHRLQLRIFLLGLAIPLVASVIYLAGGALYLDLYPYSMTLTALAFGYSVLRYRFLDIMPVARATVFSSMTDYAIVLDDRGRVVDLNPAARRKFVIHAATAIGRPAAEVFAAWPVIARHLTGAVAEDADRVALGEGEDASYFDIRVSPLDTRARFAKGRLVVLRDITAQVRAEADRERLIQSLDAFAHMVAHDIKSPLSVMVSYSLLLQEDWHDLPEVEVREYLSVMSDTGTRAASIVDSLLLFATVDKLPLAELQPVDMAPLIQNVRLRLRDVLESSGVRIEVATEWPRGIGYAPWIEEVWLNYISNAIKYGGEPPVVTLGATPQGDGMIRYWVRDNGAGMTRDEQARLFTAFTRLRQDRVDGHGLGLSIVHQIMERLGSKVGVESTPGQGSCFYFLLKADRSA